MQVGRMVWGLQVEGLRLLVLVHGIANNQCTPRLLRLDQRHHHILFAGLSVVSGLRLWCANSAATGSGCLEIA